ELARAFRLTGEGLEGLGELALEGGGDAAPHCIGRIRREDREDVDLSRLRRVLTDAERTRPLQRQVQRGTDRLSRVEGRDDATEREVDPIREDQAGDRRVAHGLGGGGAEEA